MSNIKIGDKFTLKRGGRDYDGFIQNSCECGWVGMLHYAHNDYQHSNCREERQNHKCEED